MFLVLNPFWLHNICMGPIEHDNYWSRMINIIEGHEVLRENERGEYEALTTVMVVGAKNNQSNVIISNEKVDSIYYIPSQISVVDSIDSQILDIRPLKHGSFRLYRSSVGEKNKLSAVNLPTDIPITVERYVGGEPVYTQMWKPDGSLISLLIKSEAAARRIDEDFLQPTNETLMGNYKAPETNWT